MSDLAANIRSHIGSEDADRLLRKYYAGSYTGAYFDEVPDTDPNRITGDDVAAVALLSVPLSGPAVRSLLFTHADEISELLANVPAEPLHEVTNDNELEGLWGLQDLLDQLPDIGHVRRSKLLAHKRPHLVPIRDQFVLTALIGTASGSFTLPVRDALRDNGDLVERLEELRAAVGMPELPLLRVLDVVVWMRTRGDEQVAD